MKLLKRMLLIHWHYFTHEVIEFDTLNFLTGKNASGKSTIIDAMQLVLLGDTSNNFFNKSANGKNSRTLMGYLRGELGDDEDFGFNYLRSGRFTSYIALEFYDDIKDKYFTAGCCFDVYSENDRPHLFFCYDGRMPDNEFVENGVPMDITALRAYMKENYKPAQCFTTDTGKTFRQHLYGKLGGLRDRFATLLKKAVAFDPNVDIQKFISEFVCDTRQRVDVSGMQESIRQYKELEHDSEVLKTRIAALDEIGEKFGQYKKHKQNEIMYSYLIARSAAYTKAEVLRQKRAEAEEKQQRLAVLTKEIAMQVLYPKPTL